MNDKRPKCHGLKRANDGRKIPCGNEGEPCIVRGEFGDTHTLLCESCQRCYRIDGWKIDLEFPPKGK